jgi:hypothetical protein
MPRLRGRAARIGVAPRRLTVAAARGAAAHDREACSEVESLDSKSADASCQAPCPLRLVATLAPSRRGSRLEGEAITPHGQPGDLVAFTDAPLGDAGVTRHFGVVSRYSPGEMNRSPVRSTHLTPADIAVRAQRLRSVRRRAHLRRDCPADRGEVAGGDPYNPYRLGPPGTPRPSAVSARRRLRSCRAT